jgi:predicted phage tail protein
MLTTVRLLGELGRRFGRVHHLDIKTPAEAVRALCFMVDGFRQYLAESGDRGIAYRVVTEDPMGLDEEAMSWPCSRRVVIAPQPAGRGAVGKIIAGIALIAVGILVPFAIVGGGIPFVLAGAGLLLNGVAQLITPTPQTPDTRQSFVFDRANVTTSQGDIIPVLYGERIVGNLPIISFDIQIQDSL